MVRTHRARKGPGGGLGWDLGSKQQEGHRSASGLDVREPRPGPQLAHWARVVGEMLGTFPPIL